MKIFMGIVIYGIIVTPWIWNAAKLASCDFKSDYKCEVVHIIGVVIPPAAYVTVWFDDDGK